MPKPNMAANWKEGQMAWLARPDADAAVLVRVVTSWRRISRVSVESVETQTDSRHPFITVKPRHLRTVPPGLVDAWARLPLN
jgi:hypothetical protein